MNLVKAFRLSWHSSYAIVQIINITIDIPHFLLHSQAALTVRCKNDVSSKGDRLTLTKRRPEMTKILPFIVMVFFI